MVDADLLESLRPAVVGEVTFLVDRVRPVAALCGPDGSVRLVCWPDAPLPARTATAYLYPAPGCVWVVYAAPGDRGVISRATAVRVGVDGQVATRVLGMVAAIGADDAGVWVSPEPVPVVALDAEDSLGAGFALPEDASEAEDLPVEAWDDFEREQRQADEGAPDEPMPPLPARLFPPAATGPVTLCRLRADGGEDAVVASRLVGEVSVSAAGMMRLLFYPTDPIFTQSLDGMERFMRYPQGVAELDVSAGLPASVDLDALDSRPVSAEEEDNPYLARYASLHGAWAPPQVVDLTGVPGARWTLRPLAAKQVQAAVDAVREQLAGLGEPESIGTTRDGRWHRVQSRYADAETHVQGVWPATEVVLDFSYLPHPGHRFRVRHRVFDDAGVPIASPYLRDYLQGTMYGVDPETLPMREGHREVLIRP